MLWFLLGGYPLLTCALYLIVLIFSASVHEVAHAWTADKLGDPTARNLGRITLDPRSHLTRAGMMAMLLLPIGWANPVLINPRNFRKPSRDTVLVSLAGPLSNLLIAFLSFVILVPIAKHSNFFSTAFGGAVNSLLITMASLNVLLAVFNLLPIPPLDGSKILLGWLPWKAKEFIYRIEQYGFIVLILAIHILSPFIGFLQETILSFMAGVLWLIM